jgi:hypothetical protein
VTVRAQGGFAPYLALQPQQGQATYCFSFGATMKLLKTQMNRVLAKDSVLGKIDIKSAGETLLPAY